ncbi:hypothetical protein [Alteromonas gracilis]|uniref:hypothetical protein n=1 Tax=Alteromonas gracilis TaxID=1479524 RepID=UPI0030CD62E9
MFTARKLFTALTLATSVMSAAAFAHEDNVAAYTDYMVESAVMDVKQNLDLGVTYDVLTASHKFEPEASEDNTLVADITITPIEPVSLDDNDA